jgi:hypothetical protein
VPSICEFFGIAIFMYYNDHAPPHFHAEYSAMRHALKFEPYGLTAVPYLGEPTTLSLNGRTFIAPNFWRTGKEPDEASLFWKLSRLAERG